ncbi:hypothetical protein FRC03_002789 [Tulasnella sp. 419]|nr:hypothetical protein FRC03_002789 [Tulasnella sp. 419]
MICLILPPMGSGLLNSKPRKFRSNFAVTNKKKLELNVDNLEHFVAAAGYAQAATYHNLTDPPFVYGGRWAVAEFVVPPQSGIRNQLVVVPTVAIFTECHCGQGTAELTSASLQEGGPMLTGKWNDCQISIPIDDAGRDQFNVTTITDCPTSANLGPWNQPVAFTFYSSEVKKAATVFCWPQISLYNVKAEVNISTGALQQIYTVDQNVAGREAFERMSGRGHNGLSFDIPLNDTKAQAKAYAITSGLPAAIYEVAKRRRSIATVVQDMNGFWSLTKEAYTRYLAIVAKYAYFVDDNSMIQGEIETYETTIFV